MTKGKTMNKKQTHWSAAAGILACAAFSTTGQAQSSDALLDKLVDKGVLTVKEANELKDEADKNFTQAYQVKSGMPDWVSSFKINGDFRGRYEGIYSDSSTADRNRFRYRLRLGAVATIKDDFEVGLRLTSSEPASGGVGGDPISGNTSFNSNGSKKFIYLDQAYARWSPHGGNWASVFTVGKMENPFVFSDMVFDGDYTPEGFGQQFAYTINDKHALKMNLGQFAILESNGSSQDSFMLGAQVRLDSAWTKKISTSAGLAGLTLLDDQMLGSAAVPDQNRGNLRSPAGVLAHGYNPLVADASVTYALDSFPGYKGAFPIKVGGEYMNNTATDKANEGYSAGVFFGKSGKKGLWDVSYRYKVLEGDAWYEEFVDSDFGAVYRPATGLGANRVGSTTGTSAGGYFAGANIRGHIVKATYSPYDSLTFGVTYFLTEAIEEANPKSIDTGRLQVDANWKF
jgi:hypothetical protein